MDKEITPSWLAKTAADQLIIRAWTYDPRLLGKNHHGFELLTHVWIVTGQPMSAENRRTHLLEFAFFDSLPNKKPGADINPDQYLSVRESLLVSEQDWCHLIDLKWRPNASAFMRPDTVVVVRNLYFPDERFGKCQSIRPADFHMMMHWTAVRSALAYQVVTSPNPVNQLALARFQEFISTQRLFWRAAGI